MLQIIRPIIQQTDGFDKLFASTFALPEFRSYSKNAAKASEKITEILAAQNDLPDDVAEQILMDQILVRDVEKAKPAEQIAIVDTAIGKKVKELSDELASQKHRSKEREDSSERLHQQSEARIADLEKKVSRLNEAKDQSEASTSAMRQDLEKRSNIVENSPDYGKTIYSLKNVKVCNFQKHDLPPHQHPQ